MCPVSMLMASNIKLPKLEAPEIDQHLYQSMLGSLMYGATGTRPYIMFAVHYLSQFSIALGLDNLNAMKHVYRYLNGMQNLRIIHLSWKSDPGKFVRMYQFRLVWRFKFL